GARSPARRAGSAGEDRLRGAADRPDHELPAQRPASRGVVSTSRRGKLRVLALMDKVLVPPDDPGDANLETVEWKTEFHVVRALRTLGHEVRCLGVGTDLGVIRAGIEEFKPEVVFNLLEDFKDVPIYDQNVVAYLELLDVPYTGCNSRGLMLARDK